MFIATKYTYIVVLLFPAVANARDVSIECLHTYR